MRGISAHLDRVNVNGTRALNIRNTKYNLVKRNDEGKFEPVDSIDSNVSFEDLESNYGVWVDKKLTKGILWWKRTVREKDGQVQSDEVKNFPKFREGEATLVSSRLVNSDRLYTFESADIEVKSTDSGNYAELNTEWSVQRGNWRFISEYISPMAPLAARD